jgi:hypothetical protein
MKNGLSLRAFQKSNALPEMGGKIGQNSNFTFFVSQHSQELSHKISLQTVFKTVQKTQQQSYKLYKAIQ